MDYRHRQRGGLAMVFAGAVFVLLIVFLASAASPLAILVAAIFTLWLTQLTSLTVSVSEERVRVELGAGLIHKSIPADQIETARIVTNPWYYGWGVRLYPGGWLYNVGGFDGVEVSLRSGKAYRIGTDEPEALLTAIENATR